MKHQAGLCASVFLSVYIRMFCVAMITPLNGIEPVAAFANPLPFLAFLCDVNPIQDTHPL